ncbi:MAG: sulfatase [Akkermansiaceae bacterium]|nr:sulfatase [Akkermansiaceae bacterium]
MKRSPTRLLLVLFLCTPCFPWSPCSAAPKPNVLLICIDDLRPELKCFGADYIHSPHIDRLAAKGRAFHRHYVQAPTCGASRYTLLTGRYGGTNNGALFQRAARIAKEGARVPPSMPAFFWKKGYTTVSVGKVSHHPGGRGGKDWDEDTKLEMPHSWTRHLLPAGPWQHPRGAMHGLANGEIRKNAKDMDVFQAFAGPDTAYPDGLIVDEALKQLDKLAAAKKPFFLATGIIRPHLPFGAPAKYMAPYKDAELPPIPHPEKPGGKTTWHGSGEFMKYNRWGKNPNTDPEFALEVRKHYAACVTYADALVGRLLAKLDEHKLADNTIIVLWGDHGWHLGEHAIWGKHALFEESLRSPLIIVAPPAVRSQQGEALEVKSPGAPTRSIVESIDIFPTLCALADLPPPPDLPGTSLVPLLESPRAAGHPAISYSGNAETIRTDRYRLIAHKKGHVELYDHESDAGETKNIADEHPGVVQELRAQLAKRLAR